jgi:hypothetical protein
MLAEMDHNVGQMLDAVDRLGIRDNTIVIFASDNGPEFIKPWDGWGRAMARPVFHRVGRWHPRSLHVSLASKVPAGRVSDEIVHAVDLFPTLAGITDADLPKDRPIGGVVAVSLNGRFAPKAAPWRARIPTFAVGTRVTSRPPGRRRQLPAPGSHRTWRADLPHHALRQLVHSFHCYLFKFRFHGRLIFSLNRRP